MTANKKNMGGFSKDALPIKQMVNMPAMKPETKLYSNSIIEPSTVTGDKASFKIMEESKNTTDTQKPARANAPKLRPDLDKWQAKGNAEGKATEMAVERDPLADHLQDLKSNDFVRE